MQAQEPLAFCHYQRMAPFGFCRRPWNSNRIASSSAPCTAWRC